MPTVQALSPIETFSVTDQVFQSLYKAIVTLELKPGSKVSEADIAKSLGVSRQPVRDAFYRLSKIGFLTIRPQRATTISFISVGSIHDAVFIRTALEVACMRAAIENVSDADIERLDAMLTHQRDAVEADQRLAFHESDNEFHRTICEIAGHPSTWDLIRDQKVHLERIRYLSLAQSAGIAYQQHLEILDCMRSRDADRAEERLRAHLSTVLTFLEQVRESHAEYFE